MVFDGLHIWRSVTQLLLLCVLSGLSGGSRVLGVGPAAEEKQVVRSVLVLEKKWSEVMRGSSSRVVEISGVLRFNSALYNVKSIWLAASRASGRICASNRPAVFQHKHHTHGLTRKELAMAMGIEADGDLPIVSAHSPPSRTERLRGPVPSATATCAGGALRSGSPNNTNIRTSILSRPTWGALHLSEVSLGSMPGKAARHIGRGPPRASSATSSPGRWHPAAPMGHNRELPRRKRATQPREPDSPDI